MQEHLRAYSLRLRESKDFYRGLSKSARICCLWI